MSPAFTIQFAEADMCHDFDHFMFSITSPLQAWEIYMSLGFWGHQEYTVLIREMTYSTFFF